MGRGVVFILSDEVYNKLGLQSVISDPRREVDENYASLDCYAASILSSLPTRRDSLSVASSRAKNGKWTDRMYRNVGKELPLLAAY
jgi:hypothetical protein